MDYCQLSEAINAFAAAKVEETLRENNKVMEGLKVAHAEEIRALKTQIDNLKSYNELLKKRLPVYPLEVYITDARGQVVGVGAVRDPMGHDQAEKIKAGLILIDGAKTNG